MGKVSEAQAENMVKMRKLGVTNEEIAKIYGISRVAVSDRTIPGFYQKRLDAARRRYRDEHPKPEDTFEKPPKACQLCGAEKHLFYRDAKELWMCSDCCWVSTFVDRVQDPAKLIKIYTNHEAARIVELDVSKIDGVSK